jgi:hypothetical protein
MTLQGVQSVSPPSQHAAPQTSQPARIVDVAAAPATPNHDSIAVAASIAGVLIAIAAVVLISGYRPSQRHGRHRSRVAART